MGKTLDFVVDFCFHPDLPPCPYCKIAGFLKPTFSSEIPLLRRITGYVCRRCGAFTALVDLTAPEPTDPTFRPAA